MSFTKLRNIFFIRRHLASIKFSASGNLTFGSLIDGSYRTEAVVIFTRNLNQSEAYDQEERIFKPPSPSHLLHVVSY